MSTIPCRVCSQPAVPLFRATVLGRHPVQYFECPACRAVLTEQPHWLAEAYASALNLEDTGILMRNLGFRDRVAAIFLFLYGSSGRYLDYAGGLGVFTRMMRDLGFDYFWDDRYAANHLARGFEHQPSMTYAGLTAFEVFEHLVEPATDLAQMAALAETIVFSTKLLPEPAPAPDQWWYYGLAHGQHVMLYRRQTLAFLAARHGFRFFTDGSDLHVFTRASHLPQFVGRLGRARLEAAGEPRRSFRPVAIPRGPGFRGSLRAFALRLLMEPLYAVAPGAGRPLPSAACMEAIDLTLARLVNRADRAWTHTVHQRLASRVMSDMELLQERRSSGARP